jgi:hypothetical protein
MDSRGLGSIRYVAQTGRKKKRIAIGVWMGEKKN